MFFLVTLTLSSSAIYYVTDQIKWKITLGSWLCGLRLFKLERPLYTGFEPRSLAWLACSTGQNATTYTTVAATVYTELVNVYSLFETCIYLQPMHNRHLFTTYSELLNVYSLFRTGICLQTIMQNFQFRLFRTRICFQPSRARFRRLQFLLNKAHIYKIKCVDKIAPL